MKVMHYYTYPENAGGPLTYIKNITESEYLTEIEFSVCYQGKPASQIKKTDIKRIISDIKSFSPDILHIHGVQSEGFIGVYVGKKAKVPRILMTVHGLQIDAQNISTTKKMLFKYLIEPYALRNSQAVYCVCEEMTRRPFIKKHSKKLLPTIHNFITDKFLGMQTRDVGDKTDKIIVATVGRVSFDKGMYELEEVIRSDTNDDVQYWVIGSGDYEDKMKANLSSQIKSSKVVFWGQQKEVKAFVAKADIFLFLSHHENLSIALLEAASQNCCCIATNVGGNPEVISSGIDGILIPPMDAKSALHSLNEVIKDKEYRQKLSKNLYNKILSEYGEKMFSERLLTVYSNMNTQGMGK